MTRLELLCSLHGMNGGTIHMFNNAYKTDFLAMGETDWGIMIALFAKTRLDSKFIN